MIDHTLRFRKGKAVSYRFIWYKFWPRGALDCAYKIKRKDAYLVLLSHTHSPAGFFILNLADASNYWYPAELSTFSKSVHVNKHRFYNVTKIERVVK